MMKMMPLLNFDKTFGNSLCPLIIPCDVETLKTKKQSEEFIKYIFTSGDVASITPASCDCGHRSERFYLGEMCPICNTVVMEPSSLEIGYSAWLEVPQCLPPLLQPAAYQILKNWMKKVNRVYILDAFLDPDGRAELPDQLRDRFQTGPHYFYEHFDEIMEFLFEEYPPLMLYNQAKRNEDSRANEQSVYMARFLEINREAIFARYFPAMDSRFHVLNTQGTMSLADESSKMLLKAANEIGNINLIYSMSPNSKEIAKKALEVVQTYALYAETILDADILSKHGFIRRHILGSRCHFTFRAVISPIVDNSPPDEIKLSWKLGVMQFKLEILNLLINRMDMSPMDAQFKHEYAISHYDPDIDQIFKTLIAECPFKGLPTIIGRNPSLQHGGCQLFYITEFKTDITDDTMSIHAISIKVANGDFDGKQMHCHL